jgi:menaquinone-dependent protoporphyrinogen IX oxidase
VAPQSQPSVLIVYFSLTQQTSRVAEAIAGAFQEHGCTPVLARVLFTDDRWVPRLSQFPMKHPISSLTSILLAQLRHETGEIATPQQARDGDYDLVVLASPTWWFQTSMPIRSYLASPGAQSIVNGKPFACVSVSRRYYSINLRQQARLGVSLGGRCVGRTHFVVAGGQVKSMLSWLGYMKHGEAQQRVLGLRMPPPSLQPNYAEQARKFVGEVVSQALVRTASGTNQ